jgi:monoamine oxidase
VGLGAAALGTGLRPARAAAAVPTASGSGTAPRIAVIGAGISGLNAAPTLADKGVASTVYEANPGRIGGRMYSQGSPANPGYWAQGQVSEWGGELVDTDHHTILDLYQRFGFGTTAVRNVYGSAADQNLWSPAATTPAPRPTPTSSPSGRTFRTTSTRASATTPPGTTTRRTTSRSTTCPSVIGSTPGHPAAT